MVIFYKNVLVFINCSTYEKHDCYTVHIYVYMYAYHLLMKEVSLDMVEMQLQLK